MTTTLDYKEMVFARYDGFIVAISEKGFAVSKGVATKPEIWLPQSQVGRITYCEGGDSVELEKDRQLTAIEMPRWLARDKNLIGTHQ